MKRLLFITSNRIGDAVLSTGVLGQLLDDMPDARVTIACGPAPAPLFRAVPRLERVIVMRKGRFAAHWRRLWLDTAFTIWDKVVDLRASAFAWSVPTSSRLVYRPTHDPIHRVRQLGALLGQFDDPPAPRLWFGDEASALARSLVPGGGPILAVGPTASWAGKQWPAASFASAIGQLIGSGGILRGARVAVFGAPGERNAAQPVIDAITPEQCIDLVGAADLDVVAACLERCTFYLGNDSGLMHMAAAAGVPTLGLFGPSDDDLYAPWGGKCAFIRGPRSFRDIVYGPGYDYSAGAASYLRELDVDKVVAAANGLWHRLDKQ